MTETTEPKPLNDAVDGLIAALESYGDLGDLRAYCQERLNVFCAEHEDQECLREWWRVRDAFVDVVAAVEQGGDR